MHTLAFMTEEHEELFYSCALSLARGHAGNASFFVAADFPARIRKKAQERLGEERLVLNELVSDDIHAMRAAMEEGRTAKFDDAFIDIWVLGECDEVIATPASSFGYMAVRVASP